jgi:Phage integrase family
MIPLHPECVELLAEWTATNSEYIRSKGRLLADEHELLDRRTVHRYVAAVAKRAGVGHVHPHQLRHTLATQSINRGMSLEAIAALLGHRSMDMTLTYARISDRTVAEAYFKVTQAVEAEYYGLSSATLAPTPSPVTQTSRPDHRRLLVTGHCTRPGCVFESVCEQCGFFETGPQFVSILKRQRKHADQRGQSDRSQLFDDLIEGVAEAQ